MTDAYNVPLKASFGGWTFAPWFAWGSNSMGPKLVLHPERFEYRLFKLRSKPYTDIAQVDYRSTWRTENIILEFKNSRTTFIGNTMSREIARKVIRYLRDKECPLSERAEKLINDMNV